MKNRKIKDKQFGKLYLIGREKGSVKNGAAKNAFGSGKFGLFLARGPTI